MYAGLSPAGLCPVIFRDARWFQGLDAILDWLAGWLAQMASISCEIFFGRRELVGNNNGVLRAKSINFKGLVSLLSWRNYCFEI